MLPGSNVGTVVLLVLTARAVLTACPRLCECKWRSGKESVVCSRANLHSVPAALDPGTQLLDLTANRMPTLPDDAFYSAGLLNLQRIYLSECGIKILKKFTFRNLVNLVELDLARNRLEAVPSHALAAVPELRDLRLDGNLISKIKNDEFSRLVNLVRLDLSNCRIFEIEFRGFSGLEGSLEFLKLDNNKLKLLRAVALASLRNLRGIELAGNPWECTCDLRPLREWMILRNVPATVAPECSKPQRVASKSWDRLDLDDFACAPEVKATEPKASGLEGGDITIACRVDGVPAPHIRWLRAGRQLANYTGNHMAGVTRAVVLRGEGPLSNLTIRSADIQDAGPYTCSAENRAGKAEASVTLVVEKRTKSNLLNVKTLLAALAVIVLLVLSGCLVVICMREAKRKRNVLWNEQIVNQTRRDENYEKIEANKLSTQTPNSCEVIPNSLPVGSVSTLTKKRGHYRNVPSHDTEDEVDGYDEEMETPTPTVPSRESLWRPPLTNGRKAHEVWPPVGEPDLHIPRLADFTRNDSTPDSAPSSTSTAVAGVAYQDPRLDDNHINNNPPIKRILSRPAPRTDRLDNDLSGSDSEKNYPDLLEMSALGVDSYIRQQKQIRPLPPDYSFCTLPRKRLAEANCSDSRSPLLSDSRYASSGGDSSVSESYERRSSIDFNRTNRNNRRSNSTMNLSSGNTGFKKNPSLPGSPTTKDPPSATPLLDVAGLRGATVACSNDLKYENDDQFDFHASQLERFLEEYRSLREQLSKMKENRESFRRNDKTRYSDGEDSFLRRTSIAVTAASSVAALPDAATPLTLSKGNYPREDWRQRYTTPDSYLS